MARALQMRLSAIPIFLKNPNILHLQTIHNLSQTTNHHIHSPSTIIQFQALRWYRGKRDDPFSGKLPKDAREVRKNMEDEEDSLWTGSDNDSDDDKLKGLQKEIKKAKCRVRGYKDSKVDPNDSGEYWDMFGSDEEKTLWTGDERNDDDDDDDADDDDDTPMEEHYKELADQVIDRIFEFNDKPKQYTLGPGLDFSTLMNQLDEEEELSPGTHARKLAFENALKKLKKGPDGRYTNVWEVMSDIDILIGAFEKIITGPEYEELRMGGPKKLNMQFFKDIQAQMRDPNYKFSPELKLKPKSKMVSRKKYQKTEARRRKARRR